MLNGASARAPRLAQHHHIAAKFVKEYYSLCATEVESLWTFYADGDSAISRADEFTVGDAPVVVGQQAIHHKLVSLGKAKYKIQTVDSQPISDGGVHILVTGLLITGPTPKTFVQSFSLAQKGDAGYFIRNDLLRIISSLTLQTQPSHLPSPIPAAKPLPSSVSPSTTSTTVTTATPIPPTSPAPTSAHQSPVIPIQSLAPVAQKSVEDKDVVQAQSKPTPPISWADKAERKEEDEEVKEEPKPEQKLKTRSLPPKKDTPKQMVRPIQHSAASPNLQTSPVSAQEESTEEKLDEKHLPATKTSTATSDESSQPSLSTKAPSATKATMQSTASTTQSKAPATTQPTTNIAVTPTKAPQATKATVPTYQPTKPQSPLQTQSSQPKPSTQPTKPQAQSSQASKAKTQPAKATLKSPPPEEKQTYASRVGQVQVQASRKYFPPKPMVDKNGNRITTSSHSKYLPRARGDKDNSLQNTLYVSNLPDSATAEGLERIFKPFGNVRVDFPPYKPFCFLHFQKPEAAQAALQKTHVYDGMELNVQPRRARGAGGKDDRNQDDYEEEYDEEYEEETAETSAS